MLKNTFKTFALLLTLIAGSITPADASVNISSRVNLASLATATTSSPPTTLSGYQSQKLTWKTCNDYFQCATLVVPIDYSNLKIGSFNIGVLRYKANNQKARLGSLVINPGGPGASGIDYAMAAEYIFSPDILDRYDIVGFDPRGVGKSAPIHCLTDKETDASYASDSKPDSAAELKAILTESKSYVAKCQAHTPNIMHFSTTDAARDMDVLRAALGDSKLNYVGKSYGTYMGTLYAKLFPLNVGRVVLDGAIDPNASSRDQNLVQAIGFDHALNAFIADCFTRRDCPLNSSSGAQILNTSYSTNAHSSAIKVSGANQSSKQSIDNSSNLNRAVATPKQIAAGATQFIALFKSTSLKPLTSRSHRAVTESLVVLGTASALYDNASGWPQLRTALKESKSGNGTAFLDLADQYSQRNPNGTYANNESDASLVIDCLDWHDSRTLAQVQSDAKKFAVQAPVFGPFLAYNALSCQYFPKQASTIGGASSATNIASITTTPIIIIGTTRDPATPYQWAVALHKIIQNSRLISLNADGHTGQGRGSNCVDLAVDKYLLTGAVPTTDLACSL